MASSLRTAVIAGAAGLILYGSVTAVAIEYIDHATTVQCQTHTWPVNAHQLHLDWCADNGYTTK